MIKKPDKPEFVGVRYDRHPMFDAGVSVGKREIYDKYEAYHNQYREAVERAVEDTTQMALIIVEADHKIRHDRSFAFKVHEYAKEIGKYIKSELSKLEE